MSRIAPFPLIFILSPMILLAGCAQNTPQPISAAPAYGDKSEVSLTVPAPKKSQPGESLKINEPSRLKGLNTLQVTEVLGRPGFLRHDSPAEIWQYRANGCTLDLYIYEFGNGQMVDHWAVRSPSRINDLDCFQKLVEQGHIQSGS
jgi:hypothetical protein